jgi:hypothetical protein
LNLNSTKFTSNSIGKIYIQINEVVIENLLVVSIIHDYHAEKKRTFFLKHIAKKTSLIPFKANSKPKLDKSLWDYMVNPLNEF